MARRLLVLAGIVFLWLTPIASATTPTPVPTPAECEGLLPYVGHLHEVWEKVSKEIESVGFIDYTTFDAVPVDQWPKYAAVYSAYFAGLSSIHPPLWLERWHELRLEAAALHAAMAMTSARIGYEDAWQVYRRLIPDIWTAIEREEARLIVACPDFYSKVEANDLWGVRIQPAPTPTPTGGA